MTKPKLSLQTYLKGKIGKHSANRVRWVTAKEKASKKIDPDATFKKVKGELGTELDKLRDLVEAAKKYLKAYPTLDAADKKLVENQAQKCQKLIRDYKRECVAEQNKAGINPAKKNAWKDLEQDLETLHGDVDTAIRGIV
jgi:hypothetical protein